MTKSHKSACTSLSGATSELHPTEVAIAWLVTMDIAGLAALSKVM